MTLAERLSEYVQACFTGIWIESHEHEDALTSIHEGLSSAVHTLSQVILAEAPVEAWWV